MVFVQEGLFIDTFSPAPSLENLQQNTLTKDPTHT